MNALLLRLGTGDLPEGRLTAYALMSGTTLLDIFVAGSDDAAIAKAHELGGGPVECEPGLAEAAQRRSCQVRELAAGEAADRAFFALSVFSADAFDGIDDPGVLLDYFEAAYVFAHAVRNDARRRSVVAVTTGSIGQIAIDERRAILVEGGDRPSIAVVSVDDLDRMSGGGSSLHEIDRAGVDFVDEPRAVAASLEQPFGLTQIPIPFVVSGGRRSVPDLVTVEKLAGLMGATGRHLAAASAGMVWSPHVGGSIEIRFIPREVAD